ncbi:MAG: TIGR04282 family arsenosugar biosynthesis glycosyltransferase [Dehalococcoidia bacterium]
MESFERASVLDYYFEHFAPGMVDLSSSTPPGHSGQTSNPSVEEYPAPGGLPALRSAIAHLYPGLSPEDVIVTSGASEALAASALAFVRPGDRVTIPTGAYPSFRHMAERVGGDVQVSDSAAAGAQVTLVNNPTVPDGRLLDLEGWLDEMAANATRVVVDEVYLDLRPGKGTLPAACQHERAVSIGDLSKPLGLGGLRIGWAASRDPEAIKAINRAVQMLSGGPSALAMEMAAEALGEYESRLTARMNAAARNAPAVFAALEASGWDYRAPEAGWTFLAIPPRPLTAEHIRALHAAGIFLVPASVFGAGEGYRLSVFADARCLRTALRLVSSRDVATTETMVVLAKAPEPGLSKTRLAAEIGAEVAACLAQSFLEDTLRVARATERDLLVSFTPEAARETFVRKAPSAELVAQPEGDLGTRILAALNAALSSADAVVLIGTDTPHLPSPITEAAFEALRTADMVIGPATDGGFYLIGFNAARVSREIFAGVEWSTETVFATVMDNARRLGMAVVVLPEVTDIDDLASLEAAMDAARASGNAHQTRTAVRALGLEMAHVS